MSGVIAFNDLVAIGALARLREQGLDVPGDISLAGFDDIPVAEFLAPPLTTVRLPTEEVGKHAWALLREQLEQAVARHGAAADRARGAGIHGRGHPGLSRAFHDRQFRRSR